MSSGKIHKGQLRPSTGFVMVPNELIRNTDITESTLRFILWVHSHSDSFQLDFDTISKKLGYKRDKTRAIIKNGEETGYIARRQSRDAKGLFTYDYYVFLFPEDVKQFLSTDGSSTDGSSTDGSSTDGSSTDGSSGDGSSGDGLPTCSSIYKKNNIKEEQLKEYQEEEYPPYPQSQKDGEGEAPISKLVTTTESNDDTHTSSNQAKLQEKKEGAGVVRQTGTIEQSNNYDASFMNNRRQNRLTGNYMSNQFDAWMETANRPDKAFAQWLYQKRYEKQGKLVADAVSEILNNYERAELLWEEYKQEQAKRVQHQNLLKENGMAPAKSETTPSSLPANYKETATAPEIKPLKQSQIPHLRFGKGVSTNIPSWQKYANRKIEDLE